MYIAQTTIETSEGVFRAGETVRGLSQNDVRRMAAAGYITGSAEKEPEAEKTEEAVAEETTAEEAPKAAGEKPRRKRRG